MMNLKDMMLVDANDAFQQIVLQKREEILEKIRLAMVGGYDDCSIKVCGYSIKLVEEIKNFLIDNGFKFSHDMTFQKLIITW